MGHVSASAFSQASTQINIVDFGRPDLCAFTNPLECIINGYAIRGVNWNWRDLLQAVSDHFIKIEPYKASSFVFRNDRPFMTERKPANAGCRQLSNKMFIVVSYDIPTLVRMIGKLCEYCGVTLDKVEITYIAKPDAPQNQSKQKHTAAETTFNDIIDFEYGKNGLLGVLDTHFQTLYGYSNINLIWEAAQNELSMFLNDNAINTATVLWGLVVKIFGRRFTFSNPHIWQSKPNYSQNVRGLVINIARRYGGVVTRNQIDSYFSQIKINTPTNHVIVSQNELLFCDSSTFVPTEDLSLNDEQLANVTSLLKNLFSSEDMIYIVLRDIQVDWFSRLPQFEMSISWTPMLLQEVLRIYPGIGFRIIMPNLKGQSYDTLGAVIVPSDSDIQSFADIVHHYCYTKYTLPCSISAENLRLELRRVGMIDGNELIYNMHKALKDYRFAFDSEKTNIKILER